MCQHKYLSADSTVKYGTRAVLGHVLMTEREGRHMSALAKTSHLLCLIDIVEHVWGWESNCLGFYMSLLMV